MTHFNHPKECTPEAEQALQLLLKSGCILCNQSVLLKGINDSAEILSTLHDWLLHNGCRPYLLYHCDYTMGVGHFRVPFEEGLNLIKKLRGYTGGIGKENTLMFPISYATKPHNVKKSVLFESLNYLLWNGYLYS